MNRIILFFTFISIHLPASYGQDFDVLDSVCSKNTEYNICQIPFELVYTHRKGLFDRNVQLDGFLLSGINMEPPPTPGNEAPMLLLFSSVEHANLCQVRFAINITSDSDKIFEQLWNAGGSYVSISGRFQRYPMGVPGISGLYWGEIVVTSEPVLIANGTEDLKSNCLLPSNPLPYPEPPPHEK